MDLINDYVFDDRNRSICYALNLSIYLTCISHLPGKLMSKSSVTEMLQDLQWDTLETMRRHARLSTIYKMCHGLLDGDWGDYLITSKERRTRGSHDFKFIVPKGHKDIF